MFNLVLVGDWQALFDSFSSVEPSGQSFGGMVLPKLCASYFWWVSILKFGTPIVSLRIFYRPSCRFEQSFYWWKPFSCHCCVPSNIEPWFLDEILSALKFFQIDLLKIFFLEYTQLLTWTTIVYSASLQRTEMRKTSICTPYVFMCFPILSEGGYELLFPELFIWGVVSGIIHAWSDGLRIWMTWTF